jgi:hypothetical protein
VGNETSRILDYLNRCRVASKPYVLLSSPYRFFSLRPHLHTSIYLGRRCRLSTCGDTDEKLILVGPKLSERVELGLELRVEGRHPLDWIDLDERGREALVGVGHYGIWRIVISLERIDNKTNALVGPVIKSLCR